MPGFDRISYQGADLYVLDLAPLLADFSTDPSTLLTQRLTSRTYSGNGQQSNASKYEAALNPSLTGTGTNNWGTVFMHAIEMRTWTGLKLVYVSNERRVANSNNPMGNANHNFNLHIADILPNGSIANDRQLQYYTTTSALSPSPLRNGLAFSYQASTDGPRMWHTQGMDSEGRWFPIAGFGIHPELIHLGTLCVKTKGANPGDYFVGARYYNANNEGFGTLWSQDLSRLGVNAYDVTTQWATKPRVIGATKITQGATSSDYPSAKLNGVYIGKFTSPRCGGPDELYFAYSPTSANGRLNDPEGNRAHYRSLIGYRPNIDPFHPLDPVNVAQERGQRIVIEDSSETYSLVWPTPVMSWQQRTGDAVQRASEPIADPQSVVERWLPHALVGTSALYNTDRKPFDCWLGAAHSPQQPYSPNKAYTNVNQENDLLINNQDGLTYIQNQTDFCQELLPSSVLGIAVNLTSNKTNMAYNFGYETDGGGRKEVSRLLGVYDVRNQADQSFLAEIPANAPFELHLIDSRYGLKLTDVRSWHSLKPSETLADCGGCHQHEQNRAIPFAGTVADQNRNNPLDMVSKTPRVTYDAACQPVVINTNAASFDHPEWKADIWPKFNSYCSNCHANTGAHPSAPQARQALSYSNEAGAYNQLQNRNWANTRSGALGSPAFWAARGERTDGRNNNLPKYQPSYGAGEWGFRFSQIHATQLDLCGQNDLVKARWVHDLGRWIDNRMPRNTGAAYGANFDWYHPSVHAAAIAPACNTDTVRVGVWDDSGSVDTLTVELDGQSMLSQSNVSNGWVEVSLGSPSAAQSLEVEAFDHAGNRQTYRTSIADLNVHCAFEPGLIFFDGFESGGMNRWSSSAHQLVGLGGLRRSFASVPHRARASPLVPSSRLWSLEPEP